MNRTERRLKNAKHQLALELASLGGFMENGELTVNPTQAEYMSDSVQYAKHINEVLQIWDQAYSSEEMLRFTQLEELIAKHQRSIADTTRRIDDADDRFNELRDKLSEEVDRLTDEKRLIDEESRYKYSVLATKKSQMEANIRKLLELELVWLSELKEDGAILEVDLDRRFLVINIGSADGVTPGTRFEVFSRSKGDYRSKGLVEVTELENTIATCRIVRRTTETKDVIVPGDLIGNPVFNKHRPQSFVLAGEFSAYNRSDLARFLERSGAKVIDTVGPGIDFLVAGDRSEEAQDNARQYHVLAMDEGYTATFPRYHVRPQKVNDSINKTMFKPSSH